MWSERNKSKSTRVKSLDFILYQTITRFGLTQDRWPGKSSFAASRVSRTQIIATTPNTKTQCTDLSSPCHMYLALTGWLSIKLSFSVRAWASTTWCLTFTNKENTTSKYKCCTKSSIPNLWWANCSCTGTRARRYTICPTTLTSTKKELSSRGKINLDSDLSVNYIYIKKRK